MSEHQSLIEYLLSVQGVPEDAERASGEALSPEQSSLLYAHRRQAALLVEQFTDQMPGGFFIYRADRDEEILYANKAILRMFNCATIEEFRTLTGNSFRGMVHPDDLEAVEASIWEQIANSRYDLDYVEYRVIPKGGGVRWVEDYGHFIHSKNAGDVFYVFAADATEKRQRELEERSALLNDKLSKEQCLQNQIEEYNLELERINQEQMRRLELIEGLSIDYESIFYVDLDEDLIQPYRVSTCAEYRFGKDLQVRRFVGFADSYVTAWVHPEDRESFLQAVDPVYIREMLSTQKAFHINYRIMKEGRTEYLQILLVNVGKGLPVSQIMFGCRSVDDELRHEREHTQLLENALTQAKAASAVKTTFLSNMSHDIRTPMNAIVGFTTLAKSHMEDLEKLRGYMDMIEASSGQLLRLMDDVLEISRLEAGNSRLNETACSLLSIAQELHALVLPRAAKKNIDISLSLDKLQHPDVYCDRQKLLQILMRLTSNAVKYTENGGWVTITFTEPHTSQQFATYQFVVEDNGIGISETFMEHIFEPFERQKNTTLSGVQGTGLGLPIAKSMVEMMGGSIDVYSVLGEGSRFIVTVSLRLQENEANLPHPPAPPPAAPAQRRILLVEDNPINREIEVDLLEDAGFLVDTAADGSIAVETIKASSPGDYDLILMDLQMPVMDGHTAARTIRSLDNPALAGIPIVALSANAFDEDRRMSAESGMNAHLAKPVDLPQLLAQIEELVGPTALDGAQ